MKDNKKHKAPKLGLPPAAASAGPKGGPFPSADAQQAGHWVAISADDDNSAFGGGRRTVTTEVMAVPGGGGWVMRSIVGTSEGDVAVSLCYIPKK